MRLVQPMDSMWTGSSRRVSVVIPAHVGSRELEAGDIVRGLISRTLSMRDR